MFSNKGIHESKPRFPFGSRHNYNMMTGKKSLLDTHDVYYDELNESRKILATINS